MLHETIRNDDFSRLTIVTTLFRMATTCNAVLLPFNQQRPQQLRKRFEKWIRAASNFIALVTPFEIRQMLAFFSGVEFEKTCNEVQEQKKKVVDLCSRPPKNVKLSIFTSCGSRAVTAKKCAKERDVELMQSCFFPIVFDVAVVVAYDPWYFYLH